MDEAEHSRYVAQLRAEFDRCDTTATGFLDRDELTELFRRLQLDAHLELLLDALLGERPYGRVNFEEFKDGFVDVLSRSLDISTSEEDSSYLEPALPQEVQPKLVKGTKRYGRRSRPEPRPGSGLTANSGESTPSGSNAADSSPPAVRRAKLRRSTSLESLEVSQNHQQVHQWQRQSAAWVHFCDVFSAADQQEDGGAGPGVQTAVCDPLALQDVDVLLRRLDGHLDGQAGVQRFRQGLWSSAPTLSSTPLRSAKNQQLVPEEGPARSASPSLLTATVGPRVLSRLDDGSGSTSPERVAALWTEEGIRNSWEILQTLDFSLEDRLSLADLTLALDNELLVSGNGIHQAALISYRSEIQHLQEVAEQACRERDKLRADLELADHRNLQLVREVDDRHASMETLNESRIRDLEQDFRERLTALRCQAEQESEALLQQGEQECSALQEELQLLRAQEAELQEELGSAAQEKQRVEEELEATKMKLRDAEGSVQRMQKEVEQLLNQKFGSLDPSGAALSHEERFSEILRDYELQCRELQDRNDELSSELELLRSRKGIQPAGGAASSLSWSQQYQDSAKPSAPAPLPQGNYYERQLDMMKQNMEVERKDISQAFKLEISELEEQKVQLEQQVKQLKETVARLQVQVQQGGGRSGEVERRMQRERAELEQNYATEISNLVQKLSGEKEQLEAELKLRMDQELMRVRKESQNRQAEARRRLLQERKNLKEQLCSLQEAQAGLEEVLEASRTRCSDLENRLEESIVSRDSLEVLKRRLVSERSCMQEELQQVREEGAELQLQVEHLRAELRERSSSPTLQTVALLRAELEKLQEVLRSRTESISRLTAELDSLKTDRDRLTQDRDRLTQDRDRLTQDRDRLTQDLKEQAVVVDTLQLQLDQRRSTEAALQEEQNRALHLRSSLLEEQEEVSRLNQENRTYMRLVDQLSAQIVEMEEEISSLREHLRGLSQQLNDTADLVLDLRRQLNSRTSQAERLRVEAADGTSEQVVLLQRALQNSQNQLSSTKEDFERQKGRLAQQLMELENLVLDLEDGSEAAGPHRTQLEEVRSENAALQERLKVLQQEVQNLEDEAEKKRRRLQEVELDRERSREEEERLHRENSSYREEVLELSSRNLQLSSENGELSSRLHGEQESVRMLQERLATVTKKQEEEGAAVQQLQEEKVKLQEEMVKLQEELISFREKLGSQSQQEAELRRLMMKLQKVEQEKQELQRETENRTQQVEQLQQQVEQLQQQVEQLQQQVEQLQQQVVSLQAEAELLRSQLLASTQDKLGHAQEVTQLHRKLGEALSKVEETQADVRRLMEEKEELQQNLQDETRRLLVQNQELRQQVQEVQQQQKLRSRLEAATARAHAQDQEKEQQLEEEVKLRRTQLSMKQEQFDKATAALQRRADQLEVQLKALRLVLQDKVQELKEQVEKNVQSSGLLKDLYLENAQLMKALQVTERRQKQAEKKNRTLEDKVGALNQLLKEVVATVLST
ncbi:PREDICTED: ninein-like protein [Cyprinodon variegatus]|uniref:ninein-like protein n=1 Tax=Cyprinodon variegatus TaxID=28743 RepID=UPI000742A405|nr:PREDICTED: ninein-like protein [Cyprinodon variegatus]